MLFELKIRSREVYCSPPPTPFLFCSRWLNLGRFSGLSKFNSVPNQRLLTWMRLARLSKSCISLPSWKSASKSLYCSFHESILNARIIQQWNYIFGFRLIWRFVPFTRRCFLSPFPFVRLFQLFVRNRCRAVHWCQSNIPWLIQPRSCAQQFRRRLGCHLLRNHSSYDSAFNYMHSFHKDMDSEDYIDLEADLLDKLCLSVIAKPLIKKQFIGGSSSDHPRFTIALSHTLRVYIFMTTFSGSYSYSIFVSNV